MGAGEGPRTAEVKSSAQTWISNLLCRLLFQTAGTENPFDQQPPFALFK